MIDLFFLPKEAEDCPLRTCPDINVVGIWETEIAYFVVGEDSRYIYCVSLRSSKDGWKSSIDKKVLKMR